MDYKDLQVTSGDNFTVVNVGPAPNWGKFTLDHPRRGKVTGKLFLGGSLGLDGMEVSINLLPPGGEIPFLHSHKQNEELYLFLGGEGEMQVDGVSIPVKAGSAVRIKPAGLRSWRNTGSEPLTGVVIQAKAGSLEQATAADGIVDSQKVVW